MTNPSHFTKGTDASERGLRGQDRMRQIGAEMKAAVAVNSASMIKGLFREPTADEVALAELIASGLHRAAKLRERGRNDLDVLREVAAMLRDWRSLPRVPVPATERSNAQPD
jgi:hypothetical protein